MNATTAKKAAATGIVWKRKKVWGGVGMTHYASITIGENVYRFALDQPSRNHWVGRGWVNGDFFLYRDSDDLRTLAAMKAEVVRVVAELRLRDGAK